MHEYENLRQKDWIGFTHIHLERFEEESKPNDEIDKNIYNKLLELDTRLGTTASKQLLLCLSKMTRSDIIKV